MHRRQFVSQVGTIGSTAVLAGMAGCQVEDDEGGTPSATVGGGQVVVDERGDGTLALHVPQGLGEILDAPADFVVASGQAEVSGASTADRHDVAIDLGNYASRVDTPNGGLASWSVAELRFSDHVELTDDATFARGFEPRATKFMFPTVTTNYRDGDRYEDAWGSERTNVLFEPHEPSDSAIGWAGPDYTYRAYGFPHNYSSSTNRALPSGHRHTGDALFAIRSASYTRHVVYRLLFGHLYHQTATIDDVYASIAGFLDSLGDTLVSTLTISRASAIVADDVVGFLSDTASLQHSARELVGVLGEYSEFTDWKKYLIGTATDGPDVVSLRHLQELAAHEFYDYVPILMAAPRAEGYWSGSASVRASLEANLQFQRGILQIMVNAIDAGLSSRAEATFTVPVNPEGGFNHDRALARHVRDLLVDGPIASIDRTLSLLPRANPYANRAQTGPGHAGNDLVTFVPPTVDSSDRTPSYAKALRYQGATIGEHIGPAPIARNDGGGKSSYFRFTDRLAFETSRSDSAPGYRLKERYDTDRHTIETDVDLSVPNGIAGARIGFSIANAGDAEVWIRTPGHFVADGIGIGRAHLQHRTGAYRFTVNSASPTAFNEIDRWVDFPIEGDLPSVAAFDDEKGYAVGLFGGDTGAREAMTEGSEQKTTAIRLFVDGIRLEPGDAASWDLGIAAHAGGEDAPEQAAAALGAVKTDTMGE